MSLMRFTPGNIMWSPGSVFRQMDEIRRDLNRLMDVGGNFEELSGTFWSPTVDICESGDAVFITAELPGVKREDIDVRMEGTSLILRGKRHQEQEVKEHNFYRMERSFGEFQRIFPVPVGVKTDQIKASLKEGVLKITLPKAEPSKAKQIQVQAEK